MPTSSIFSIVRITDPEKVEAFVEALEASSREVRPSTPSGIQQLKDIEAIRRMMGKKTDKCPRADMGLKHLQSEVDKGVEMW